MSTSQLVYCPVAAQGTQAVATGRALDDLRGKTVGFIDNAKPNFHHLVDDLEARLVEDYGVKAVRKHRKRGQVPIDKGVLSALARECDVIITGSGD
jgi:hypothetical protein